MSRTDAEEELLVADEIVVEVAAQCCSRGEGNQYGEILTLRQRGRQEGLLGIEGSGLQCLCALFLSGALFEVAVVGLQFGVGLVQLMASVTAIDGIGDEAEEEDAEEYEQAHLSLAGCLGLLLGELFDLVDDDYLFFSIDLFSQVEGVIQRVADQTADD